MMMVCAFNVTKSKTDDNTINTRPSLRISYYNEGHYNKNWKIHASQLTDSDNITTT